MTLALLLLLAPQDDYWEKALRGAGIDPTADGVVKYLRSLGPTDENRALANSLVRQLGDESFDRREEAYEGLRRLLPTLRALAGDAIDKASASNDLEIQSRARRLMREAASSEARYVLRLVLMQAVKLKAPGTAAAVLPLAEFFTEPTLRRAVRVAVRDGALPADEPMLREAVKGGDPTRRAAAAGALGDDIELMKSLLTDSAEEVRLAAARALAHRGERECLEPLGALLSSKDVFIRQDAVTTLRLVTGKYLEFSPHQEGASTQAWTDWIRDEGPTAKLTFPLPDRPPELGRTLICVYGENKVIEVDLSGKVTFEVDGQSHPWGCFGMPDGHRLISCYSSQKVTEYDETGKEIWSKDGFPGGAMSVQRLDNGNTLVACSDGSKVMEVARDGSIAREVTLEGRPTDAKEIPDGHWLVTLQNGNRVVEIDLKGNEVWKLEGLSSPLNAQRLDNGNTLVAEMGAGRVAEYDAAGKRGWTKDGLSSPYDAQRLENGNTLVVDGSGVTEFDPSGTQVWKFDRGAVSRIYRY